MTHGSGAETEAVDLWKKSHVVISTESELWDIPFKGKIVSWMVTEPVTPSAIELSPASVITDPGGG